VSQNAIEHSSIYLKSVMFVTEDLVLEMKESLYGGTDLIF
jgi:hypothetical protein